LRLAALPHLRQGLVDLFERAGLLDAGFGDVGTMSPELLTEATILPSAAPTLSSLTSNQFDFKSVAPMVLRSFLLSDPTTAVE
jgi:hypothetical protein